MHSCGPQSKGVATLTNDLCALVVTYRPGANLGRVLAAIADQVNCIVIIDNHSPNPFLEAIRGEAARYGAHLIENAANLGIARALNLGVQFVRSQTDAAWVVCFDQDTESYAHQVATLRAIHAQYGGRLPLGIIGSNYLELPMKKTSYADVGEEGNLWMQHDFAITSGSLISLQALEATGGFRDEFFIDCVDFDFSFRARLAGYETVISRVPLMAHTVGNPITKQVGSRQFASSNHRAERRYYRVRNITVLTKEYVLRQPSWVVPRFFSMIKSVLLMCWLEHERPRKLRYVLRGFYDGLRSDFSFSPLGSQSDKAAARAVHHEVNQQR